MSDIDHEAADHDEWNCIQCLVQRGIYADGEHHKQWILCEIARLMDIPLEEHDEGVPP